MEKAAIAGSFFKVPMLWGLASSGHTRTCKTENISGMAKVKRNWATWNVVPIRGEQFCRFACGFTPAFGRAEASSTRSCT
jgi:hypothetical protein